MATYYDYDVNTGTVDQPGIQFDGISSLAINGTATSSFFIPMILTTYSSPTYVVTMNETNVMPVYDPRGGLAYGGNVLQAQGALFPKLDVEGTIDCPITAVTETGEYSGAAAQVSAVTVNSIPLHWVEVLAMFFEGRYSGARYDPSWYRDPYGRQYNSPRMFDYTASYIAGSIERANFTMSLMIKRSPL